jgi:adenylosuccinate lyase
MSLSALTAISPIDGRYHSKANELSAFYSEAALIKYRLRVEVEYFISLCELPLPQLEDFDSDLYDSLRDIYLKFDNKDAQKIKDIESITNHDVKAVEYFIKERFDKLKISKYKEFIHFALTSQDINNTATPLLIKESVEEVYVPNYMELLDKLISLKNEWATIPLLARTHGQAASPTLLGKEIMVFIERLERQIGLLNMVPFSAKFGGATGNFNAHHIAYPEIDWVSFSNDFVDNNLGLDRSQVTTQIEH